MRTEQAPFLRASAGVLTCLLISVAVSSAAFSFSGSWGAWFEKISIHADKANVNHLGLRNVVAFDADKVGSKVLRRDLTEPWTDWQTTQLETFARRKPIYYTLMAAFGLVTAMACRKKRLDQAAIAGMLLVPILFYPANYYFHYVFLLPLIATVDRDPHDGLLGWVSAVLLGMCAVLYLTLQEHWTDVCFTQQSYVLLIGFAALLVPIAWKAWEERKHEFANREPLLERDGRAG